MDYKINDLQEIEKYIKGELQADEVDALWVKFLRDPALYRYFDIQLHIRSLIIDVQSGLATSPFEVEGKLIS